MLPPRFTGYTERSRSKYTALHTVLIKLIVIFHNYCTEHSTSILVFLNLSVPCKIEAGYPSVVLSMGQYSLDHLSHV